MRLIDADALMRSMGCMDAVKYGNKTAEQRHNSYRTMMMYEIADCIECAPTIDAVPVVRCKDCSESEECPVAGIDCLYCGVWATIVHCNGYCDRGAKMDAKEGES